MADTKIVTFYAVKQTVAGVVSQIQSTNEKNLDYFGVMAAIFDLHKKYPNIAFPEDNFNKYCTERGLCRYIYNELKTPHR